jgi:hypothetical protein
MYGKQIHWYYPSDYIYYMCSQVIPHGWRDSADLDDLGLF